MMGSQPDNQGIIPHSFEQIYAFIDDPANKACKFLVRCSFLEIYNEEIRDLLTGDDKKLELREDVKRKDVFVQDLNIVAVKSID